MTLLIPLRRYSCNLFVLKLVVAISIIFGSVLNAGAREIGIAFVEDGRSEPSPKLSTLIVQELQPLLRTGDTINPIYLGREDVQPNVMDSYKKALASGDVDYIVATGFSGSQEIYNEEAFAKPTFLLRVLDPDLTGLAVRDTVQNLRSYSTTNEIVDLFDRVSTLFGAKRVGIVLPAGAANAERAMGPVVKAAGRKSGIEVEFLYVDLDANIESQLLGVDAVVLPPIALVEEQQNALIQALLLKKIPSFVVGGDNMVVAGALISDTLEEDERFIARRVALDMQLVIADEVPTQGLHRLTLKKHTTINIDTTRAIGVDFDFDELLTARIVQGNSSTLKLGFLSSLELALERNLDLGGQYEQLEIDRESLEQAKASKRPQLAAAIGNTYRGEQLPDRDSLASVSLSQKLYSPTANAEVDVARLSLDSSEKSLEQKKLDTVQQTATAYFQALQAQAQLDSELRNLTLNRENLALAQQRNASGSGTGAEIYRWEAIIANSQNAVLRAFTANSSAQSRLAQLVSVKLQIPTTLADVSLDQPPFDLLHEGLESYLKSTVQAELLQQISTYRAITESPLIDSAKANVAIFETQKRALERSIYTPELSLVGQYSHYLDSSETSAGVVLDGENDWSLMLSVDLPLWLGGQRRSLIRQYKARGALADSQLQSVQQSLWATSSDVVNDLIVNYRTIELSEKAEAAALKSQQVTQNAYRLGSSSITELLDTQNEYSEAQVNAQIARYTYLTALVDFQALMGEMPMLEPGAFQVEWLREFKQSMVEEAVSEEVLK